MSGLELDYSTGAGLNTARLNVFQDNYGDWRWALMDGGNAVDRSDGSFAEQEEALEDVAAFIEETGFTGRLMVDGASRDITTLMKPPKINAAMEAARAGIPQQQLTPEQEEKAQEARERLRSMGEKLSESIPTSTEADTPDVMMGTGPLDEPEAAQAKRRRRSTKSQVEAEMANDPLMKQRKRVDSVDAT